MLQHSLYYCRTLCFFWLLASISMLASAADSYYLKDDGSRWRSSDGTPVKGLHKSSLYICKQGGACRDLMAVGRGSKGRRLHGALWHEANLARQQLKVSGGDRTELDAATGQALYDSADYGPERIAE